MTIVINCYATIAGELIKHITGECFRDVANRTCRVFNDMTLHKLFCLFAQQSNAETDSISVGEASRVEMTSETRILKKAKNRSLIANRNHLRRKHHRHMFERAERDDDKRRCEPPPIPENHDDVARKLSLHRSHSSPPLSFALVFAVYGSFATSFIRFGFIFCQLN